MQTCFEILGVKPDATQKELKRAYFVMVRQYPPEKDPDQFQKIRVAYEEATKALELDVPVFGRSDNPKEAECEEAVFYALQSSSPASVVHHCKSGLQKFPKNQFLLYHHCRNLRLSGQGTNAIKAADKLLKQDPDNRHYQMELAMCYIRQGWTKKARELCDKIMAKGSRNAEFLLAYSELLTQYKEYSKIYDILYKLITENDNQNSDHLAKVFDACVELITASAFLEDADKQADAAQAATEFIRLNQNLLGKEPVAAYCKKLHAKIKDAPSKQVPVYQNAIASAQTLASAGKEARQVADVVGTLESEKILNDKRLPKCIFVLYRAYIATPSLHPNAVKMDARLCGIMEREELLACKDILKSDYPELYAKITPFLRAISTEEKAAALKEELLEKYEEYDADYFPDRKRYFYEFYPDEKPYWMEDEEDEDDDDYDDYDDDDDDDDDDDFYHYFFDDDDDDYDDDEEDDPFLEFLRALARRRGANFPY